ncbi:hypothetical protein PFICI_01319 [Pestalotiopsis fici W106-1]|uniref:Protein DSF2 n=1 Tax=Pestalotiopsis fici (strain W106-1 / CGMCC3.15140) TaxID=1229662 RepID=W3XQE9_PESFW|nr:uncharacterized protein PFICI_01319 [Pestalotiopsis fici W106-1]ETS87491.1 hypothetical protein PFICI_01319 [Pestalotiopsis fici W106-1]
MGLRDMLKKKDRVDHEYSPDQHAAVDRLAGPEFTFIRSDTHTQEVIYPPPSPGVRDDPDQYLSAKDSSSAGASKTRRSLDVFKPRSRGSSLSSSKSSEFAAAKKEGNVTRRLSHRLHLSRALSTSEYVPENLPTIKIGDGDGDGDADGAPDKDAREREWEKRATILAQRNEQTLNRSASISPSPGREQTDPFDMQAVSRSLQAHSTSDGVVSSKALDDDIQEAIRLHEEGQLQQSTAIFGRLADPHGDNNPLSQVLYGLALRHGWGCEPDVAKAVSYLSIAAANAAEVENLALKAGLKKGGAAKGELVLAMFELANCFRQGWGVPKDPVAAKNYYETAANLGDSDAMNEVAWCYLEGFGCKKDKFLAAKYYRLAEKAGNKTLGNTW